MRDTHQSLSQGWASAAFAATVATHCAVFPNSSAPGGQSLAPLSDLQLRALKNSTISITASSGDYSQQLPTHSQVVSGRALTFASTDTPDGVASVSAVKSRHGANGTLSPVNAFFEIK